MIHRINDTPENENHFPVYLECCKLRHSKDLDERIRKHYYFTKKYWKGTKISHLHFFWHKMHVLRRKWQTFHIFEMSDTVKPVNFNIFWDNISVFESSPQAASNGVIYRVIQITKNSLLAVFSKCIIYPVYQINSVSIIRYLLYF